jgi:subtilase family serine protease
MKSRSLLLKDPFAIVSFRSLTEPGLLLSLFIAMLGPMSGRAGEMRVLRGHVPPAAALSQPLGRLSGTNSLRLAISLPLRNQDALTNLLQRLYDPTSPDYHQYLTPTRFNEKFGPTHQDYQKVIEFARSNGFEIVATRGSRMLLDIQAKASDVERAFHVALRRYQHPTEARQFYAPDVAPTVDADLPILNVAGLGDYAVPLPMSHLKPAEVKSDSLTGSGPDGLLLGSDFRNAYAPGVTLTGAGQAVGLLELDGYVSNDIVSYETLAGLTNVPLINIDVTNFNGAIGSGQGEVTLDIEMAIAMAPGLSAVYVFQADPNTGIAGFEDIFDSMASSTNINQFSSSWSFSGVTDPDTTTDGFLQKMAAQGQTFFQASGDGDAWINRIEVPSDSPYLTSVGGTLLTMNGAGASYASETVWNAGNQGFGNGFAPNEPTNVRREQNDFLGSGGGISTVYLIPSWQTNAINSANQGSTSMRNIPDVALAGTNIFIVVNSDFLEASGTSCAAPLWAGFTALVNQQAAAEGSPTVGFINPAIYAIGQESSYTSIFHDITTGNNSNLFSANLFLAVPGYDLCTGWGTPNGAALINALSPNRQSTMVIPVPIVLNIQLTSNGVVLTWSDPSFSLYTAPTLTNTFTIITGATSPYTNTATSTQMFFRLVAPATKGTPPSP